MVPQNQSLKYNDMDTITLIIGYPNAGKTTYSKKFINIVHLDDYMHRRNGLVGKTVYQRCNNYAKTLKGDICVEGIYDTADVRKEFIRMMDRKDAKFICIWLDASVDECIRREDSFRNRPHYIIHRSHSLFEQPTVDEGWDDIIHIELNDYEEGKYEEI